MLKTLLDDSLPPPPDPLPSGPLICALRLPWPPSANHIYRPGRGGRRILTDEAKAFRAHVQAIILERRALNDRPTTRRLAVALRTHQPKGARCDIANAEKATLDALEKLVFANDEQVDRLLVVRGEPLPAGSIDVWIHEFELPGDAGKVIWRPEPEPIPPPPKRKRPPKHREPTIVPKWRCPDCGATINAPRCMLCGTTAPEIYVCPVCDSSMRNPPCIACGNDHAA